MIPQEAKDTIMDDTELLKCAVRYEEGVGLIHTPKAVATKQAEISFKTGKQEGRREVVEWINNNYPIGTLKWQTQLKDWGI